MENNDNGDDILENIANLPNLPVKSTVGPSRLWRSGPPVVPRAVPPPLSSSSFLQRLREDLPNSSYGLWRYYDYRETRPSVFLGPGFSVAPWTKPYSNTSGSFSRNRNGNAFPLDSFPRSPENNGSWSGHVASSSSNPLPQADLGLGSPLSWVAEFRGRVADVARDMNRGRILEDKLSKSSPAEVDLVALEIMVELRPLSVHRYGHYVVMKLLEVVDHWRLAHIFYTFLDDKPYLITICTDEYGSQVMTKLVERLKGDIPRQRALIESVCSPDSRALTLNSNSTHFLDSCFLNFSYDGLLLLIIDVSGNFLELATNIIGNRVMQQCISMSFKHRNDDGLFRNLMENIIPLSYYLANDSFGKYVVQHVIEDLKESSLNIDIYRNLKGKLSAMSTRRDSRFVVQKLICYAENVMVGQIVEEIMKDTSNFFRICTDKYGNNVVQTCIKQAKLRGLLVYGRLANFIIMNKKSLRSSMYGVQVMKAL